MQPFGAGADVINYFWAVWKKTCTRERNNPVKCD